MCHKKCNVDRHCALAMVAASSVYKLLMYPYHHNGKRMSSITSKSELAPLLLDNDQLFLWGFKEKYLTHL